MILNLKLLRELRPQLPGKVVVTNGCFDLIHAGHVALLEKSKSMGSILIVGINGDQSVRQLKGPTRPIVPVQQRCVMVNALRCVDYVCIFEGIRGVDFLQESKPDIYVKGGDYTLETLDPSEREALGGAEVRFLPLIANLSTTNLCERLSRKGDFA